MASDSGINLSRMKLTSRMIAERSLARGWKVQGFETNPAILLLHTPNRTAPIKIFSASPPQMSYPAVKIAKDKFITNQILGNSDLPVPQEILLISDENDSFNRQKIDNANNFLQEHHLVVVKPLDAAHGKGITVNVNNAEDLKRAINHACNESEKKIILIQEQIKGHDIRAICIDYKFVDAISRVPASVIGDGLRTVAQLIETTNQSTDRGQNYQARLNKIPAEKSAEFLGKAEMSRVPSAGELVQVIGVSNTGMGGERLNIKHSLPAFLKEMAETAAKTLDLPVCGVDFFVSFMPSEDSSKEDLKSYIIEVNECPSLIMYEDIHSQEQLDLIDCYLDYLAGH